MPNLRPTELILILAIVLLLFGAKKLPDLAKSIGESLKIFRKETADLTEGTGAVTTSPNADSKTVAAPPISRPRTNDVNQAL